MDLDTNRPINIYQKTDLEMKLCVSDHRFRLESIC